MISQTLAEVTRGGQVESVHSGSITLALGDGTILETIGNPERFTYFRSSAKPFQAIPVISSGAADAFGFTAAELALCCASHNGDPRHQEQVAAMLAKIGLSSDNLQCGISLPGDELEHARVVDGVVAPSPLQCDCSGKHTGMLAVCQQMGYPIENYLKDDHPLQQWIREIIASVCQIDSSAIVIARDGCSLPTFGMPFNHLAVSYATFSKPENTAPDFGRKWASELDRLRLAMMKHPENVSGPGTFVTDLMRIGKGKVVAKSGAEGLVCLGIPATGVGIAVRVDDGSFRSHPAIVLAILEQLQALDADMIQELKEAYPSRVYTHNGWDEGEIRAAFPRLCAIAPDAA